MASSLPLKDPHRLQLSSSNYAERDRVVRISGDCPPFESTSSGVSTHAHAQRNPINSLHHIARSSSSSSPLTSTSSHNISRSTSRSMSEDQESITKGEPGRRLKRLSLLAKPILAPLSPSGGLPTCSEVTSGETCSHSEGPETPKATAVGMNRERSKGIRSSISYATSPISALRSPVQINKRTDDVRDWHLRSREGAGRAPVERDSVSESAVVGLGVLHETEAGMASSLDDGDATGVGDGHVGSHRQRAEALTSRSQKGITVTEKYADLLTLIAQKERQVNELRLELAQQELALDELKQKWTTIATRTARPSINQLPAASSSRSPLMVPGDRITTHSRLITQTSSTSASSSSSDRPLSPPSINQSLDLSSPILMMADEMESQPITSQDVQAAFSNLIATAYGPEGVVTPSAVEGGKRFWGQLVKTVSAAAIGNVPASESDAMTASMAVEGGKGAAPNVPSLKNLVSLPGWTSLIPAPSTSSGTRQIRQPANLHRLPRSSEQVSPTSAPTTLNGLSLTSNNGRHGHPRGKETASSMSSYHDLMDLQEDHLEGTVKDVHEVPRGLDGGGTPGAVVEADGISDDEWGW